MERKTIFRYLIVAALFIPIHSSAQITVTQTQVQQIFPTGNYLFYNYNPSTISVNIGTLGGPNTYDFRNVTLSSPSQDTVFSVSSIPELASRYSTTSSALKDVRPSGTITYLVFSFPSQQFVRDGDAFITTSGSKSYYKYVPGEIFFKLPLSYNSQFSQTIVQYIGGSPSDTITSTTYVDAYGTLLLPGGLSLQCLRVRYVPTTPHNYKLFRFITREGVIVFIYTPSTQPDIGTIQVGSQDFELMRGGSILSVKQSGTHPNGYFLSQNYPNPFNPLTTIKFNLQKSSFVTLKIFNLLGQEVEMLVNERLNAGEFQVKWNGNDFPSGTYLYRLESGDLTETKKIILLR